MRLQNIVFILVAALFQTVGFAATEETEQKSWDFLPKSRHSQYLTYALFTEEQTTMVAKSNGGVWAAFGDSLAILEKSDWKYRPQLIFIASVNTSFRTKGSPIDFNVETLDARFGLLTEWELDSDLRFAAGVYHYSGHAVDGILDPDLVPVNMGQDLLYFRLIKDFGTSFRMGATLRPFVQTDPSSNAFAAEQFVEWFPWLFTEKPRQVGPYLAVGLEQYGRYKVELTTHAQLGWLMGNHFLPDKLQGMRIVAGYYHGNDPRLKYYQFKQTRADFFYFGVMINL